MDCLDFKGQIVRTIPKAENTSEHKYGQNNTIKAIQSAIRSEQSKQYNQQYDQDDPGGGNNYIAGSTYAKIKHLSKKSDVQEVDVGR